MSIRRNQPCPCGSGEKYKKCCGSSQSSIQDQKKVSVKTDSAEAYYNKGNSYLDRGMPDEAAAAFRKAISLRPDYIEASFDLGFVIAEQGNFPEATTWFKKVLSLSPPTHLAGRAHYFLALILMGQGLFDEALTCYKKVLAITPFCPDTKTGLAILAWLKEDDEACRAHRFIITPQSIQKVQANSKKYVLGYSIFLDQLLKFRDQHPALYLEKKNLPVLYALGDSHCLSLANIKINFKGRDHRIESKLIQGCKAWHLGNKEKNHYKIALKHLTESIPSGSSVILQFGEIDCRLNEGILPNHKKTNDDLSESIPALVNSYLNNLLAVIHGNGLDPILCNIPAPLVGDKKATDKDKKVQADIVKIFNQALDEYAWEKKIPVLDTYSASKNEAGITDGECHIDGFHLKTSVFIPLIEAL